MLGIICCIYMQLNSCPHSNSQSSHTSELSLLPMIMMLSWQFPFDIFLNKIFSDLHKLRTKAEKSEEVWYFWGYQANFKLLYYFFAIRFRANKNVQKNTKTWFELGLKLELGLVPSKYHATDVCSYRLTYRWFLCTDLFLVVTIGKNLFFLMRIFLNLFFYENLFESLLLHDNSFSSVRIYF